MVEYLRSILDREWQPVPRWAACSWIAFFALFLVHAWTKHGEALVIDSVNLVVHEAGHALFGWLGATLGLWGGTIFQLLVPFALASYFLIQRQLPGFVFCGFFFFENFLGIATYMADARAQNLPLVTLGDPEFVVHDWNAIFSSLGLLAYDTRIAALVRTLGWLGMILVALWFARKTLLPAEAGDRPLTAPSPR
jgi:hypothetical protein